MSTLRNALNPIHWRIAQPGLGRLLFILILLLALVCGAVVALRLLRPAPPDALLPGQQLAGEIAKAIQYDATVQIASGTYLPGNALVLYTKVTNADTQTIRVWSQRQLEPFRERLRNLPAAEELIWLIDLAQSQQGETIVLQEVLTTKLGQIADPMQYQYSSNRLPGMELTAQNSTDKAPLQTDNSVGSPDTVPMPTENLVAATQPGTNSVDEPTGDQEIAQTTLLRSFTFQPNGENSPSSAWRVISGRWAEQDGLYRQLDAAGYDYITMSKLPKQRHYSMEVQLRMNGGEMGGGLIYNAPNQESRVGAQVIDMDEQGRYLRWGYYNTDGLYTFVGGVTLETGLTDGAWHQLRLVTQGDQSVIWFDGQEMGRPVNQSTEGFLGLVTSRAQIDFDDLVISTLPPETLSDLPLVVAELSSSSPILPSETITESAMVSATAAIYRDDFAAGNRNGWQVLDGTWQFLAGAYQQSDLDGSDLGTVSTFQGDNYRMSVRMRLLDGNMGAGIYFNMAERTTKAKSQLIRFFDGTTLQWGAFDEGGNFIPQGSTAMPNSGDGEWHTLEIDVAKGKATFTVDSMTVAEAITLRYPAGYLGLFASKGSIAFDDLVVISARSEDRE